MWIVYATSWGVDMAVVVPTTVMSAFTRTGISKIEFFASWVAVYSTPSTVTLG